MSLNINHLACGKRSESKIEYNREIATFGIGPALRYGDYRQPHPPSAIIDAVENGDVDVAVVWGPVAGYFAAQGPTPLTLEPVEPWRDGTELPMAFYISMGVRRGENALLKRLDDSLERNRAAISAILAEYHVPVNADVHDIQVIFVDEPDNIVNPLGIKGVGEIGIVGVAAAIANAIYHATGKRVRDLPITLDKLQR